MQGDATELIRCIRDQSAAQGFTPGLVIIDTLARSMTGGDENSARDMGMFIANAGVIERELDALVVAVHHSGKTADRGMRGSSALHGAAAAEWEVSSDDAGKSIRIAKQKDGEDGLSILFRLRKVEVGFDENNDPVTTLVTEVLGGAKQNETSGTSRRKPLKGQRAEFIKAVAMATDDFGEMPPTSDHIPRDTKGVKKSFLPLYTDKLGFTDGKSADCKRNSINRLIRGLAGDKYLGQWGEWIWLSR